MYVQHNEIQNKWQCSVCTFKNDTVMDQCEVCHRRAEKEQVPHKMAVDHMKHTPENKPEPTKHKMSKSMLCTLLIGTFVILFIVGECNRQYRSQYNHHDHTHLNNTDVTNCNNHKVLKRIRIEDVPPEQFTPCLLRSLPKNTQRRCRDESAVFFVNLSPQSIVFKIPFAGDGVEYGFEIEFQFYQDELMVFKHQNLEQASMESSKLHDFIYSVYVRRINRINDFRGIHEIVFVEIPETSITETSITEYVIMKASLRNIPLACDDQKQLNNMDWNPLLTTGNALGQLSVEQITNITYPDDCEIVSLERWKDLAVGSHVVLLCDVPKHLITADTFQAMKTNISLKVQRGLVCPQCAGSNMISGHNVWKIVE